MQTDTKKFIAAELKKANPRTKKELDALKRKISKTRKIAYPSNRDIFSAARKSGFSFDLRALRQCLRQKPVRSLSGIVNVSVLTKPYPCPGRCLYCPSETGFPKSYLSGEPAAERARHLKFDPYRQASKRLELLAREGHPVGKIDLRIIGGTWSHYPKHYQNSFVARCYYAANMFGNRQKRAIKTLSDEQKINESARNRIIGSSVETRPDHIGEKEIIQLRKLGVTKVELGVQSICDDVLEKNSRGHKTSSTISATRLLKNAGFKVSYQIMPNLFGSTPKRDAKMLKEIFLNSDFQPDLLKLYPCVILPEAPLYRLFKKGEFKPYPTKSLAGVIKDFKKSVPPYVRIERIIRDIPSPRAKGIAPPANLRQFIQAEMAGKGEQCQCIRCREVKTKYDAKEKIALVRRDYAASGGQEIFLSIENENKSKLFSLLRLRIPQNPQPVFPVLKNAALIREIHTYGQALELSDAQQPAKSGPQHTGLGKKLIKEAERIAKTEFDLDSVAAISGIGARNYWRTCGYALKETYMVKKLENR